MEKLHASRNGSIFNSDEEINHQRPELEVVRGRSALPMHSNLAQQAMNAFRGSHSKPTFSDEFSIAAKSNHTNPLFVSIKNSLPTASPPPPALSPASLSPSHSSVFNSSSRASPAPPVIAEEDSLFHRRSNSSQHLPAPLLTNSAEAHTNSNSSKAFETRPSIRTQAVSTTSESTSSSSSVSTSSEESHFQHTQNNGIPILEKMSVSLKTPQTEPILSRLSSPDHNRSPNLTVKLLSSIDHKSIIPQNASLLSPSTMVKVENEVDKTSATKIKKRKTPIKKKRATNKRWKCDSDSDFDVNGRSGGRASGAIALVKRFKENAKKTPADHKGKKNNSNTNSAEVASRRRYLESPFFCLCQSSTTHSCGINNVENNNNNTSMSNSMPAHVINPALKDFSKAGDPVNCPVLQATAGGKNNSDKIFSQSTPLSELASFFANSLYKPTLRGAIRDARITATYADSACGSSWCCVFCGERSDFLLLGPLYGPYFLTKYSTPSLLPLSIAPVTPSAEVANTGGLRLVIKAISPPASGTVKLNKKGNAIVERKRKSAADKKQQQQPPVASSKSQQLEQQPQLRRIGGDGEIWFHLECVLWAPGTLIQGDGVVNGLEDAVSMALDAACSHCKKPGAILSCRNRGCNLCYHYKCAELAECHFSMEQFSVLCKKHFVYS